MLRLVAITCLLIGMIADEGSDPDFRKESFFLARVVRLIFFIFLTSEERSDHDHLYRITDCPPMLYW